MASKGERLSCPVCGLKNPGKFWAMSGYRLAECAACSLVWDHHPLENLTSQYSKAYFINENPKGGYTNYFEGMRVNKKTFAERLKRIESKYGRGKLLDVGCALGDCLVEARRLGWKNPQGVEVSDYAYKFAKKRGLDVRKGTLGDNSFERNSFDVVTYQDVLEHVADPVSELKLVRQVLRPDGVVFLVTPDVGGWWKKILGKYWYHYKPGEHVIYFSQKSLKSALEKAGFVEVTTSRTYHILSVEYVINRLKYYSPLLFGWLLSIIRKTPLKNISFRAYTGEIEAWGVKN